MPAATLTFSITGGNTNGAFAIDPASGALRVGNAAMLDYETTPVFTLTINVSDGALSDSKTVTINLVNSNDAPVLTLGAAGPGFAGDAHALFDVRPLGCGFGEPLPPGFFPSSDLLVELLSTDGVAGPQVGGHGDAPGGRRTARKKRLAIGVPGGRGRGSGLLGVDPQTRRLGDAINRWRAIFQRPGESHGAIRGVWLCWLIQSLILN